ncbi:MAG: sel1 repeat family protein, partial [Bacteroidaceae bacterium]|nr:sel1 repeat family protein [Bacteroidaceae bacterium]
KGLAISQSMLGHCYLNGNGVAQDSIKAREWYDKAAAQGEPRALFAISTIMEREDSIAGYSKRKLRKQPTVTYLERAATNRHIDAQYKLAQCYEKGWYVKKSKKKAFNWYLRAANQGHPEAMERVGYCYEKGRGVKKDEHRAAKWYRLAEQNGQEYARKKMEWYNALHFFEE